MRCADPAGPAGRRSLKTPARRGAGTARPGAASAGSRKTVPPRARYRDPVLDDAAKARVMFLAGAALQGSVDQDAPATVLLQLDASGSMAPAVEELRAASSKFLASLRPADRVILTSFNSAFAVLAPAMPAADIRPAALNSLRPAGQNTSAPVARDCAATICNQALS